MQKPCHRNYGLISSLHNGQRPALCKTGGIRFYQKILSRLYLLILTACIENHSSADEQQYNLRTNRLNGWIDT